MEGGHSKSKPEEREGRRIIAKTRGGDVVNEQTRGRKNENQDNDRITKQKVVGEREALTFCKEREKRIIIKK